MERSMIKAFIFDVDGVLVDSEYQNFVSLRDSLKEVFNVGITLEEDKELGPIPTFKKLEILKEKLGFQVSEEQYLIFMELKFALLLKEFNNVQVNQSIPEIFKFLKSKKAKIAIVSNARRVYVEFVIDVLGSNRYVDYFIGNDSRFKPKPFPDMYTHAMEVLGVAPSETLIFEDSDVGIRAAKNSGAKVFQVRDSSHLTLEIITSLYDSY